MDHRHEGAEDRGVVLEEEVLQKSTRGGTGPGERDASWAESPTFGVYQSTETDVLRAIFSESLN